MIRKIFTYVFLLILIIAILSCKKDSVVILAPVSSSGESEIKFIKGTDGIDDVKIIKLNKYDIDLKIYSYYYINHYSRDLILQIETVNNRNNTIQIDYFPKAVENSFVIYTNRNGLKRYLAQPQIAEKFSFVTYVSFPNINSSEYFDYISVKNKQKKVFLLSIGDIGDLPGNSFYNPFKLDIQFRDSLTNELLKFSVDYIDKTIPESEKQPIPFEALLESPSASPSS